MCPAVLQDERKSDKSNAVYTYTYVFSHIQSFKVPYPFDERGWLHARNIDADLSSANLINSGIPTNPTIRLRSSHRGFLPALSSNVEH